MPAEGEKPGSVERTYSCGAEASRVEETHFAEITAGAADAQESFFLGAEGLHDLDATIKDYVEPVTRLAFDEQDLTGRGQLVLHGLAEANCFVISEGSKNRRLLDGVRGEWGHGGPPFGDPRSCQPPPRHSQST